MNSLWLEDRKLIYREDIPIPTLGKNQALIRVLFAGICSTDLELLRGYYPYSGIPGHEFVGEVVSSPDQPDWIGKRVVGEINIACGICEQCKSGLNRHCFNRKTLGIHDWNGAFAKYLMLPITNLHQVPDQITSEKAVFTEPLAAAHEIIEQTSIQPSDRVLVLGAGRLGQLVAAVLQQTGCHLTVVTRHRNQHRMLSNSGIQTMTTAELGRQKFDVIIEATGSTEGFDLAARYILPRGRIILKSTYAGNAQVNFSRIVVDEVTLIGSRCGAFEPALKLLMEGQIDPTLMIEATYPIKQGVAAFEHANQPGVLKVLIRP